MLSLHVRAPIARLLAAPMARLARTPLTPDALTITGTVGVTVFALALFPVGQLFWGTIAVTVFVLMDLLDGQLARAKGRSSRWGAFLDSSLDRVSDAAIFGALVLWFTAGGDSRLLACVALYCLASGALTSYIKARAEALGMTCDVGIAERAERCIVILLGTGLTGIGVAFALPLALWLLAAATTVTVGQRLREVHRQAVHLPALGSGPR